MTRREQEVAELVAQGLSNSDIAATLVISRRTAESHLDNILTKLGLILTKLGLRKRTQVAAWMIHRTAPRLT